jgi:hypothetical protein
LAGHTTLFEVEAEKHAIPAEQLVHALAAASEYVPAGQVAQAAVEVTLPPKVPLRHGRSTPPLHEKPGTPPSAQLKGGRLRPRNSIKGAERVATRKGPGPAALATASAGVLGTHHTAACVA